VFIQRDTPQSVSPSDTASKVGVVSKPFYGILQVMEPGAARSNQWPHSRLRALGLVQHASLTPTLSPHDNVMDAELTSRTEANLAGEGIRVIPGLTSLPRTLSLLEFALVAWPVFVDCSREGRWYDPWDSDSGFYNSATPRPHDYIPN